MGNDNHALFGVARLEEAILASADLEPPAIIDAVFAALEGFASGRPYDDDCTIVVMKATA